ncbi:hypothetical protein GH714_023416 [Hevea brasiliensis]|uniref:ACB domain-containing protein n=1 Tax=Hevea brasiliensis TaxID=3981 RepID=A0A6A6M7R1_HEVBR|nr:hypothetical protein GH714_023416 [Hevea brasiliensis]
MDQRVEQLEQTVQSLSGGQEGIAKRLEELFSQLNVRMDRLTSQSSQGKGIDSDTATPESRIRPNSSGATSSYTPKMVKLDFPRFDEKEDATSWVCRAEQFFQFHRTPDEDRVEIASFHMIGDAQLWYQVLRRENPSITWDEFKEGFYSRYGANQLTDFFGELAKLQQQGTVQSYQVQFEKLLAKVGDLSQARQVSCFVSGLAPAIRTDVQANRPKSLSEAIALARLFEARNSATGKGFSATRTTHQAPRQSPTNSPQPATGNIKRLTWDELNERKRLGLCFKCNEKFGPGHRCKKLFSIQAVLEDSDDDADMEIEEHDPTEEIPAISLHAIAGFEGPETMRLTGTVEKLKGIILVDSGSTHNFGSQIPENQIVSAEHMEQLVKLLKRGFLLQITGSTQSCSQVPELHPEIQGLLEEFRGVLAKPKGLPPQRCHDHKIPLKTPEPISEEFEEYAEKAKTLPENTTNESKLILYGLYKQATVGPVNTSRPGMFNMRDRAKWDAWKAVEGKSKEQAMSDYITKGLKLLAIENRCDETLSFQNAIKVTYDHKELALTLANFTIREGSRLILAFRYSFGLVKPRHKISDPDVTSSKRPKEL